MDNTCTPSSTCFFGTRTTWLHSARLVGAAVRNRFLIAPLIVVLIATFSGGLGRQYWLLLRECLIHMSSTIWISIGQQSHGSEGSSGTKPSRNSLSKARSLAFSSSIQKLLDRSATSAAGLGMSSWKGCACFPSKLLPITGREVPELLIQGIWRRSWPKECALSRTGYVSPSLWISNFRSMVPTNPVREKRPSPLPS